jgi:uncharacterized damage-inducible protein DinB
MAWANAHVIGKLREMPDETLSLSMPSSDWAVSAILEHFVRSAGFYAFRLGVEIPEFTLSAPTIVADLADYQELCSTYDTLLRTQASKSEGSTTFLREGRQITRARSTILGQSIHHAIEHRAQIAGILVIHGITDIDLDEIDVWALGDAEGLGE